MKRSVQRWARRPQPLLIWEQIPKCSNRAPTLLRRHLTMPSTVARAPRKPCRPPEMRHKRRRWTPGLLLPRMLPIPVLRMMPIPTTHLRVVMPGLLRVVMPGLLRVVMPGLLRVVMPVLLRVVMPGLLRVVMPVLLRVVMPVLLRVVMPGLLRVMPTPTLGAAIQEMRLRVTILGLLLWIPRRRAMRRQQTACRILRRTAMGPRHLWKGKTWPIWMTPCQSRVMVTPPRALPIPAKGLIRMLRTAGTHMTLPIPVVQMRRMMSAESKSHSVL